MKALCGTWVNFEEIEAYLDEMRSLVDRFEKLRRSAAIRDRCDAYRSMIDSIEADLDRMRQRGILVDAVPVYNLGIVDRPETGSAAMDSGSDRCVPVVDFGDGDSDAL